MHLNDFVIENNAIKKYTGNGGNIEIPDSVETVYLEAFKDVGEEFNLIIPETIKEIITSYSGFCRGLVSLQIPCDTAKKMLCGFACCPNLKEICVDGAMTFSVPDTIGFSDIFVAVNDVLFWENSNYDKCREFLEKLKKRATLHAIWRKCDKDVKSKLEESGLKSFFKDCYVVDSLENEFNYKVMAYEYFGRVIEKNILEQYPSNEDCSYRDIVLISGENIFYDKGSWFYQLYFDPNGNSGHEHLATFYGTSDNFEDVIRYIDEVELKVKLKHIVTTRLREVKPFIYNSKYSQYIETNPNIVVENSTFRFDRVGGRWNERKLLDELINRGGIIAKDVTMNTDYLVIDPDRSTDKPILKALKFREKDSNIQIILIDDLEKHFLDTYGFKAE